MKNCVPERKKRSEDSRRRKDVQGSCRALGFPDSNGPNRWNGETLEGKDVRSRSWLEGRAFGGKKRTDSLKRGATNSWRFSQILIRPYKRGPTPNPLHKGGRNETKLSMILRHPP